MIKRETLVFNLMAALGGMFGLWLSDADKSTYGVFAGIALSSGLLLLRTYLIKD